jgi:hypothetical protein
LWANEAQLAKPMPDSLLKIMVAEGAAKPALFAVRERA